MNIKIDLSPIFFIVGLCLSCISGGLLFNNLLIGIFFLGMFLLILSIVRFE